MDERGTEMITTDNFSHHHGVIFAQLHDGKPGKNGRKNVLAGYDRRLMVVKRSPGHRWEAVSPVEFNILYTTTVEYFSLWDSELGGRMLASSRVAVSKTFYKGETLMLSSVWFGEVN